MQAIFLCSKLQSLSFHKYLVLSVQINTGIYHSIIIYYSSKLDEMQNDNKAHVKHKTLIICSEIFSFICIICI